MARSPSGSPTDLIRHIRTAYMYTMYMYICIYIMVWSSVYIYIYENIYIQVSSFISDSTYSKYSA